jgi:hypothetical protein
VRLDNDPLAKRKGRLAVREKEKEKGEEVLPPRGYKRAARDEQRHIEHSAEHDDAQA